MIKSGGMGAASPRKTARTAAYANTKTSDPRHAKHSLPIASGKSKLSSYSRKKNIHRNLWIFLISFLLIKQWIIFILTDRKFQIFCLNLNLIAGNLNGKLKAAPVRSTLLHHQELRSDQKMPADSINQRTAPPGEEPPGGNKQGSADSPECRLRLISLSGGSYTQNLWTNLWKTKKKLSRMQF